VSNHQHRRDWTQWEYDDEQGRDVREGACRDCHDVIYEDRAHQHRYSGPVADLRAGVHTLLMRLCTACLQPDSVGR
jgi:hypothetical protein